MTNETSKIPSCRINHKSIFLSQVSSTVTYNIDHCQGDPKLLYLGDDSLTWEPVVESVSQVISLETTDLHIINIIV